jgi:cytochrome c oxidase assembly protein subunit 15
VWDVSWGLFLEHGHRTIAQLVGMVTIALAVVLWRNDPRKGMRWLAGAALFGVVFQGALGGLRVLSDTGGMPATALFLAKTHACTAPLFFGLAVVLVALTSRAWRVLPAPEPHPAAARLRYASVVLAAAVYVQIVLGAQLRHVSPQAGLGWFVLWVWAKVILAGLLAAGVGWLVVHVRRRHRDRPLLGRRALLVAGLLVAQLVLAAGTWVTNYGWPRWFTDLFSRIEYTIEWAGRLQVLFTTAHTAVGSLLLAASLSLALWSFRLEGHASGGKPR